MSRIQKMEEEVAGLKAMLDESLGKNENKILEDFTFPQQKFANKKDTTKYFFDGVLYPKNRLVLAVVKKYVELNPGISRFQLKAKFDKSIQGSIGVIEEKSIAAKRNNYQKRFFANSDDIINLKDGEMLVCTQWAISNLTNFLHRAKEFGFVIKANK